MKQSFTRTLVPLVIMILCPLAVLFVWHINRDLNGSTWALLQQIAQMGLLHVVANVWGPVFFGTALAWKIILTFMVVQLVLMRIVPGNRVTGPTTLKGHTPVYKNNGFACFLITLLLFYLATAVFHLFPATIIYDNFAGLLGAINFFSFIFCLFLYFKGRFSPSSPDHGSSGNFIFDYYWGTELYPRVLGWDVKQFTNCRFGMMSWPIILLSFAAKQQQLSGLSNSMVASVAIMMVYIAVFFWTEAGYFRTTDIMVDRGGFYLCWGCLVWVPAIYTLPAMYLVNHPYHFPLIIAILIMVLGIASVLFNQQANSQRQYVRKTDGQGRIWGVKPKIIRAQYVDEHGKTKNSILLASGWWGVSRHAHYLLEISLSFFWTLPALFGHFIPWFYVIYLSILLLHRMQREEQRCAKKYAHYWTKYCALVPDKLFPVTYLFRKRENSSQDLA